MKRTDVMVLGAGIVGTCVALHLAKRGLAVALVDRQEGGRENVEAAGYPLTALFTKRDFIPEGE